MKYVMIYMMMFSVYVYSVELSHEPIPSTVDEIKRSMVDKMMTIQYSRKPIDKDALKKHIASYPSPVELSKLFVRAYVANDEDTMKKITPQEMIDKLKSIDEKVRESFVNIKKYDSTRMVEYKGKMVPVAEDANLGQQTVYLTIKDTKQQIKFGFVWVENRWVLLEVI